MDISDAAMYFGWFALAFIPFVYLLTYINRKNDPFMEQLNRKESATGNNGSRKPHTHNDTLYNIQQKKPSVGGSMSNTIAATTSAVKSNVGKYQQKQCQQQQQPSRSTNVNKRTDKSYSHPWCLTSLKGHTDQVLDMNFSSNGKYLASCAEASAISASPIDGQEIITTKNNDKDYLNLSYKYGEMAVKLQYYGEYNCNSSNTSSSSSCSSSRNSSGSSSNEDSPRQQKSMKSAAQSSRRMSRRQRKNRKMNDLLNEQKENRHSGNHRKSISSISSTSSSSSTLSSSTSPSSKNNSSRKRPTTALISEIHPALLPSYRLIRPLNSKIAEYELVRILRENYTLKDSELYDAGFPLSDHNNFAYIFVQSFCENFYVKTEPRFDVNAEEFIPNSLMVVNKVDGLGVPDGDGLSPASLSGDSGQGSTTSSPPSGDNEIDTRDDNKYVTVDNKRNEKGMLDYLSNVKTCVRCRCKFYVNGEEYCSKTDCTYHFGKQERVMKDGFSTLAYTCCGNMAFHHGCTRNDFHVWSGIENGLNGPYDGFVVTQEPKYIAFDNNYGIYAIDCEMCYTLNGLELTKVTLINVKGQLVYEKFVRPASPIIDYNTQFSGITEKLLSTRSVKTLLEVQSDLLNYINSNTILIGHALNNDLRVLKIVHKNIIDTSIIFPHPNGLGLPYRSSLKKIVKKHLNRDIQMGDKGHSSLEDSQACLEALLYYVDKHHKTSRTDQYKIRRGCH